MRSINDLIRDADQIFEKRAAASGKKTEGSYTDTDIFKLAEEIRKSPERPSEKLAEQDLVEADVDIMSLREKIAHSVAIVDTLLNFDQLQKIASLETAAREKGFSDSQISEYLEKNAELQFRSVLTEMPWIFSE